MRWRFKTFLKGERWQFTMHKLQNLCTWLININDVMAYILRNSSAYPTRSNDTWLGGMFLFKSYWRMDFIVRDDYFLVQMPRSIDEWIFKSQRCLWGLRWPMPHAVIQRLIKPLWISLHIFISLTFISLVPCSGVDHGKNLWIRTYCILLEVFFLLLI